MATIFDNEDLDKCLEEVLAAKNDLESFLKEKSIPLNISNAIKEITNKEDQSSFDKLFKNISRVENTLRRSMLEFYEMEDRFKKEKDMSTYRKLMELSYEIDLFLITDVNKDIKSDEVIEKDLLLILERMKEFNGTNINATNSNEKTPINANTTVETELTVEDVLDEEGEYLVYLQTTDYYKKNYKKASGLMSLTKKIKSIENGDYNNISVKGLKLLIDLAKYFVKPLEEYNITTSAENYDEVFVADIDISEAIEDIKQQIEEINVDQENDSETVNNEMIYQVREDGQMSLFG